MAAIQTLLNPVPEPMHTSSPCPPPTPPSSSPSSSPPARKKQKISKDAAIFTPGQVRGECRFPPHEGQDELLVAQHQQFELHPIGEIADYPRHIPYNSEKKTYLGKTGREFFEVFQYNFRVPGDDKVHCMMWDYNIGLVRITPLFRCNGYSKTTPAKMLNRNPGLRDICHSITGGALVAQGYWMPYLPAKHIAATFCHRIRYALTPVFGLDFPALCTPPEDDGFGVMIIDPAVTRRATEEAQTYKLLESNTSSRASSAVPGRPGTPETPPSMFTRVLQPLRPRPFPMLASESGSGYETDGSADESTERGRCPLNVTPPAYVYQSSVWTPANTPRSVAREDLRPLSPRQILTCTTGTEYDGRSSRVSSPALSPRSRWVHLREEDEDEGNEGGGGGGEGRGGPVSDERAANLLISLKAATTALESGGRLRTRRAST